MATLRVLCKRHGVQLATVDAVGSAGAAPVVSWLAFDPDGVRLHRSIRELLALDDAQPMRNLGLSQPVRALKVALETRTRSQPLDTIVDDRIATWCSACGERLVLPVSGLRARHAEAVRTGADAVWRLHERLGRDPLDRTGHEDSATPAPAGAALALLTALDLEQLRGLLHEALDGTRTAADTEAERVRRLLVEAVEALADAAQMLGSAVELTDELRPSL